MSFNLVPSRIATRYVDQSPLRPARPCAGQEKGGNGRIRKRIAGRVRFFFFMLAWIVPVFLADLQPARAEETLTMVEAVQMALSRNPLLNAANQSVQGRQEGLGASRAGYFPQISASYQNLVGNGLMGFFLFPGYNSYDYEILTVTLTENIYDFGRREAFVAQNHAGVGKSRWHREAVTQNVIRKTEGTYLALLSAQYQEKAASQGVTDAKAHLAIAQNRFQNGEGIKLDVTQAEVNVEAARLTLINARETRQTLRAALARLLGLSPQKHHLAALDPASLSSSAQPVDLSRDVAVALKTRPDLKEMGSVVEQNKAALQLTRDRNLPKLTAIAQYNLAQLPFGALPMPVVPSNSSFFSTYVVGGAVSIPIFEGGQLFHDYRQAHAKLKETEYRMDDARLRVEKEMVQAALKVEAARQRWTVSRRDLKKARENNRLVEQSYRVGGARSLDVIDAQTALRKARAEEAASRYGLAQAKIDYQFAMGVLKPPGGMSGTTIPK
ncbi:MAG: TolC family protein [Nitrospirota bacterium]|nr:TolC family protein [Nitrospirota bacterium]